MAVEEATPEGGERPAAIDPTESAEAMPKPGTSGEQHVGRESDAMVSDVDSKRETLGMVMEPTTAGPSGKKTWGPKRRTVGFWEPFNSWWREEHAKMGRRPSTDNITRWYQTHSKETWGDQAPSLLDTRKHAKCLRPLSEVRDYFRKYRAKKAKVFSLASHRNIDYGYHLRNQHSYSACMFRFHKAHALSARYTRKILQLSEGSQYPALRIDEC